MAEKKIGEVITGESLDAIASSLPLFEKDATDKFKLRLLKHLNEKYGVVEEDFLSAELQLLPALKPREVGFDGALIAAYAHDDRACSYAILRALLDTTGPQDHTTMSVFLDREEIGSTGATGAESMFLENVIETLCQKTNAHKSPHRVLADSQILSADVTSALDPKYREFFDAQNVNVIGYGVSIERGSGYGGKYEGSEASAEYIQFIRQLFNSAKVPWQTGEISKVDEGGGGTVAKFFAKYGCDIIDVGPPVLAMHSPCEIMSKVDEYCAYKGYKAFLEAKF
jgi:aspartyl aminopeptidase